MRKFKTISISTLATFAVLAAAYTQFGTARETSIVLDAPSLPPHASAATAAVENEYTAENLQSQLKASDAEWEVIGPLVQKLVASRQAMEEPSVANRGSEDYDMVSEAVTELQDTLSNPYSPTEQIKEREEAVRNARNRARADRDEVAGELHMVLTSEQEAELACIGLE